ncbi:MAG: TDT family transporter, partial [Vibrio sp.]
MKSTQKRAKSNSPLCRQLSHSLMCYPTPIAGLALGIASLGWALENWFALASFGKWAGALIASFILLIFVLKVVFFSARIWQDLRDPVVGASIPAATMALMVISNSVGDFWPDAGQMLWLIAIGLHLMVMTLFIARQAPVFGLDCVNPGWFVPFVGIITACVAFPGSLTSSIDTVKQGFDQDIHLYLRFATAILWWGLVCYALLLPWIMYRLIWGAHLTPVAMPSVAVLAAPGSLSLAGYLTITPHPSPMIVSLLFGIACLMTVSVYVSFFKLLRLAFS